LGTWGSSTTADVFTPLPVTMRIVPSLTVTALGQLLDFAVSWSNVTVATISNESNTSLVCITANVASSTSAQGKGAALGGGGGSQPDYLFSAEL
jgi:hypothetical protein